MTLQAAVGPDGEWEDWSPIITPEELRHAEALVRRAPARWRIILD